MERNCWLRAAVRHLRLPVVVKTLPECYQALGIVHTTWPVVPGRFKDYISTPKQNDYCSIHHRDRADAARPQTREMHEIAEYGIAAHALYKDNVGSLTEMLSQIERPRVAAPHHRAWPRAPIRKSLRHTKPELFTTKCSASRRRAS